MKKEKDSYQPLQRCLKAVDNVLEAVEGIGYLEVGNYPCKVQPCWDANDGDYLGLNACKQIQIRYSQ